MAHGEKPWGQEKMRISFEPRGLPHNPHESGKILLSPLPWLKRDRDTCIYGWLAVGHIMALLTQLRTIAISLYKRLGGLPHPWANGRRKGRQVVPLPLRHC